MPDESPAVGENWPTENMQALFIGKFVPEVFGTKMRHVADRRQEHSAKCFLYIPTIQSSAKGRSYVLVRPCVKRLLNFNEPAIAQFTDLSAMPHSVPRKGALPCGKYSEKVWDQGMVERRHERHKPIEKANPREW